MELTCLLEHRRVPMGIHIIRWWLPFCSDALWQSYTTRRYQPLSYALPSHIIDLHKRPSDFAFAVVPQQAHQRALEGTIMENGSR